MSMRVAISHLLLLLCLGLSGCGSSFEDNPSDVVLSSPLSLTGSTITAADVQAVADGSDQVILTITALDASGTPIPGLSVTLLSNDPNLGLTQPGELTNSLGEVVATVTATTAGSYLVMVEIEGVLIEGTINVNFVAGPPAQLVLLTQPPANTEINTPINPAPVVVLQDANGNTVADSQSSVSVAASPTPGELQGTIQLNLTNGLATFNDLMFNREGTARNLTFSLDGSNIEVASNDFNIVASGGVPAAPILRFESQVSNGQSFTAGPGNLDDQFVVQAVDETGQPAVGIDITLNIVSNPGNPPGVLGGDSVETTGNRGLATFDNLGLTRSGAGYELSATANGFQAVRSESFEITNAPGQALVFSSQPPASVAAGVAFTTDVSVQDSFGNPDTGFNGAVNLSLETDPSTTMTLGPAPNLSVNFQNGVANFTGLTLSGNFGSNNTGYRLGASSGGLNATSQFFDVEAGPVTQLGVAAPNPAAPTVNPGTNVGAPFTVLVQQQDQFGNLNTNATSDLTLSIEGATTGTLTGGGATASVAGVATFNSLALNQVESYQLRANGVNGLTGLGPSFNTIFGAGIRTIFVNNQTGGTRANGFNGQPTAPLVSLSEAQAEAAADGDVRTIQVQGTGTNYQGIDLSGLTQVVTLQGQGDPILTQAILPGDGDTLRRFILTRNGGAPALDVDGVMGLTLSDLTVNNNAGQAVSLTNMTGPVALTTVSTTGTDALELQGTASFQLDSLSTTATNGTGLSVSGGGSLRVNNGGDVAATSGPALNLDNITLSGDLSFTSLTSTNSTSNGVRCNSVTGSQNLASSTTTVNGCNNSGVLIATSGSNTFNFGNTTVTAPTMADGNFGIDLLTGTQNSAFTFTDLDCTTSEGGLRAGAGTINQASWTTLNASGISTARASSVLDLRGTVLAGTGLSIAQTTSNFCDGPGVALSGGSLAGALDFGNLQITNCDGNGVDWSQGTNTVGLIAGATSNITNPTGSAIRASQTAGVFNFQGTATQNNAARLADIQNTTAGSITVAQANMGASSTGINIASCAGSVSFGGITGGASAQPMTSDTLTITGGSGDVVLGTCDFFTQGASAINSSNLTGTISNTTGTIDTSNNSCVSIVGQAMAQTPLNLNFTSVSCDNTNRGLRAINTSGSITVATAGTTNGSAGRFETISERGFEVLGPVTVTLTNMEFVNANNTEIDPLPNASDPTDNGAALYLQDCTDVMLTNVDITDTRQDGVLAIAPGGFTMSNSEILRAGVVRTSGGDLDSAVALYELSGDASITNVNCTNSGRRDIFIEDIGGTLGDLTGTRNILISGCVLNRPSTTGGNVLARFNREAGAPAGDGTVNIEFQGCTFISGRFDGIRIDSVTTSADAVGSLNLIVNNCNGTLLDRGILVNFTPGIGSSDLQVTGNTLNLPNTVTAGATFGAGVSISDRAERTGLFQYRVNQNVISSTMANNVTRGITTFLFTTAGASARGEIRLNTVQTGELGIVAYGDQEVTISDNGVTLIPALGGTRCEGISIGTLPGFGGFGVGILRGCYAVASNTVTVIDPGVAFPVFEYTAQQSPAESAILQGYTGAAADSAAVAAFLLGTDTGTPSAADVNIFNVTNGICALPSF